MGEVSSRCARSAVRFAGTQDPFTPLGRPTGDSFRLSGTIESGVEAGVARRDFARSHGGLFPPATEDHPIPTDENVTTLPRPTYLGVITLLSIMDGAFAKQGALSRRGSRVHIPFPVSYYVLHYSDFPRRFSEMGFIPESRDSPWIVISRLRP